MSVTRNTAELQNPDEDYVKVNDTGYATDLQHAENIPPILDIEEQTM